MCAEKEDPVPSTPKPVSKAKQKQLTATLSQSAPAPSSSAPVVRHENIMLHGQSHKVTGYIYYKL